MFGQGFDSPQLHISDRGRDAALLVTVPTLGVGIRFPSAPRIPFHKVQNPCKSYDLQGFFVETATKSFRKSHSVGESFGAFKNSENVLIHF